MEKESGDCISLNSHIAFFGMPGSFVGCAWDWQILVFVSHRKPKFSRDSASRGERPSSAHRPCMLNQYETTGKTIVLVKTVYLMGSRNGASIRRKCTGTLWLSPISSVADEMESTTKTVSPQRLLILGFALRRRTATEATGHEFVADYLENCILKTKPRT